MRGTGRPIGMGPSGFHRAKDLLCGHKEVDVIVILAFGSVHALILSREPQLRNFYYLLDVLLRHPPEARIVEN